MTSDRQREIERICQAALDCDVDSRAAFVGQACAGDEALRQQVEALLAHRDTAAQFIGTPTSQGFAQEVADRPALRPQFGGYQVLSLLGAGGMGEVYRARDPRLGRDVAIKVLPAPFLSDPERRLRFEREARVLGALNHPHIAAIYGLEEEDGVQALVLELVEGETLAERLARSPLSVEEALTIAVQIADALDAAHEKGIVHRDLKPANIKITADQIVKVLDFGLAKAIAPPGLEGAGAASQLPTVTAGATRDGVVAGTVGYMSPEQSRGQAVDKRTDIWAFGCVMYEMLTGHAAFPGDTLPDTIAAVLGREPDWSTLPPTTPPSIRRLMERCLEKDLKRRLRDIFDARLELEDAVTGRRTPADAPPRWLRDRLFWLVVPAAVGAVIAILVIGTVPRATLPISPVTRTAIVLPAEQELDLDLRSSPLALAPDGGRLAYVVDRDGFKELYIRELSALEATPIPGTTGATQPFFSPDSEWVAFFARGMLYKVSIRGGAPLPICRVSGITMGGSWGPGEAIVFATLDAGLFKVGTDGVPIRLPGISRGQWPEILPDAKTVLFSVGTAIAATTLEGQTERILTEDGARGSRAPAVLGAGQIGPIHFVPTGHLIFGHGASGVAAVPFDYRSLTLKGSPVSVVDAVFRSADGGPLYFTVSRTGVLVYTPENQRRRLMWVERDGRATAVADDREAFRYPRLSPDGRRIAVVINTEERRSDIWIYDAEGGKKIRLTSERSSLLPVWNQESSTVTYADVGAPGLGRRPATGSGEAETLLEATHGFMYPTSWSPGGRDLLFTEDNRTTGMDLWALSSASGSRPQPLLVRSFHDAWARFSRDGQWIAFVSDESGTNEVYIAHYPDMGDKVVVSTHGGAWPVWSRDGRELFYRQGKTVMAVSVEGGSAMRVGTPRRLFTGPYFGVDGDRSFDVALDGRRFLMIMRDEDAPSNSLIVVQNWLEELKQRAPVK